MKLFEEFKLYETMWEPDGNKARLGNLLEKWETFDIGWGPVKLWHSSSISEFRAFLSNAGSAGIKGLRLSITDGLYLAARASDLNHDNIVETAEDNYICDKGINFEWSTCGFPKLEDFDNDNFEGKDPGEEAFFAEIDAASKAQYGSYKDKAVIDPETGETLWIHDGKRHMLVADCGVFEVALYQFYSQQFPQFKYGDTNNTEYLCKRDLFETSETYFVLKPLIKKLYMANL